MRNSIPPGHSLCLQRGSLSRVGRSVLWPLYTENAAHSHCYEDLIICDIRNKTSCALQRAYCSVGVGSFDFGTLSGLDLAEYPKNRNFFLNCN